MSEIDQSVADAMAAKRRELINQPLDRIWPDLARAAIAAMPVPCPRPFNDDPQDLSADECVNLGHCGCGHKAALPQGEPAGWLCEEMAGQAMTVFRQFKPNEAPYRSNIRPVYASPSLPVSEPGVREALVRAKADLEASRTLAREVLGEPHGINQTLQMIEAALSTSPSNGEVKP